MVRYRQELQELSNSKFVQTLQRKEKMLMCGMECKEKPVTFLELIYAPLLSLTFLFAVFVLICVTSALKKPFVSYIR